MRRFRKKIFFASKRNEAKRDPFRMRFARSVKNKYFFFASFRFEFFASDLSEINRAYFRFVSLPKNFRFASDLFITSKQNEINVFSLCFALKRNEINVSSLLYTILGIDMKK